MTYTIFKTNTLLDIRAITTFGLNAKPNTKSPIGYFGTGLKMAIATLLRNHHTVMIWIGSKEYRFDIQNDTFRDSEFSQPVMIRKGITGFWDRETLSFTTELAKNWELWMAYRELESNTIDEGGETFTYVTPYRQGDGPEDNVTRIQVTGKDFADIHDHQRDTIFLPEAKRSPDHAYVEQIEIFHQPSNYIFYRGMRVMKLDKPSIMTYNILDSQQLTEDRTLKDQWWIKYKMARHLAASMDKEFINHFLNATDANWESTWDWDTLKPTEVSLAFREALETRQRKKEPRYYGGSGLSYIPIWRSSRMDTLRGKVQAASPGETLSNRFAVFIDKWAASNDIECITPEYRLLGDVLKALKDAEAHATF